MEGPANALELIETLRRKNGKEFQNFSQISQYLGLKAREKGTPVSCQFELTPLCNFSCKMCYVHEYVNMLGMRGANDVYQLLAGGRYVALK
jgi:MoaA/NifB/PqqE/SkfB family radical SAM enzyme